MRLVAKFEVIGCRPVPWSVPQVFMKQGKNGGRYKSALRNKELEFWQEYVKSFARDAMEGREPCLGPAFARVEFRFRHDDPATHGRIWCPEVAWSEAKEAHVKKGDACPDADNLFKGVLDALQGIVLGNDVQVCVQCSSRRHWAGDGARVAVWEFTGAVALLKV